MNQKIVTVTCDAGGLHLVEPRASVQERQRTRVTNSVVDLKPREGFSLVVANYSRVPRTPASGMVIAVATPNPMNIYSFDEDASLAFEKVLNLPLERDVQPEKTPSPEENTPGKEKDADGRESVDLDHIKDASLKNRILEMLWKHEDMWRLGRLGTINATELRIGLESATRPIPSMPYHQGPVMRERVSTEVDKMLQVGVIQLSTVEWASPIVLVSKKDRSLHFCVDYRRLNAKTVSDAYPLVRMDDCLDSLGDGAIFTTLDCNAGYWKI